LVSGRPTFAVAPKHKAIGHQRQLEPAAQGEAVDGGDQRLRKGADRGPMRLARVGRALGGSLALDLGYVGPGGKVALRPGQSTARQAGSRARSDSRKASRARSAVLSAFFASAGSGQAGSRPHRGGSGEFFALGAVRPGLYFAISMKLRDPSHQVTVLERNRANDTFGWGVVLSDDALGNRMQKNDPSSTEAIRKPFRLLGRYRGGA
jgi:hypothetical protein